MVYSGVCRANAEHRGGWVLGKCTQACKSNTCKENTGRKKRPGTSDEAEIVVLRIIVMPYF